MPKQVDAHERRELVAGALLRVAARDGLESISLRRVAAEAGVTAGLVQHYFPSKDAMVRFAMATASARIAVRMEAAVAALGEAPGPRDMVGAVLATLLPSTGEDSGDDARVALAFMAYAASRPDVARELEASNAALRDFVADQARAALDAEAEATATREEVATALVALVDGLAVQMLSGNLDETTARGVLQRQIDLNLTPAPRRGRR
ncbi:TetR/AcrR family transcriptional regulator [Nocardioides sp. R-C-SC26]|uniref:TetR/AcrR family transcriptional regulator n=1 Tax=Nocardioides sp. R-C-SC26 TaxID=2870414 RepID=UPI001E48A8F0|nr:TetR family transcriptional regulator C-terminal domain-containing protein [Nocardioides sp. R-C-SC26]